MRRILIKKQYKNAKNLNHSEISSPVTLVGLGDKTNFLLTYNVLSLFIYKINANNSNPPQKSSHIPRQRISIHFST